MPLLTATNIRHNYGNDIILDGCLLSVEAGERVGVVGRNGTGKTTLLRIMGGVLAPDDGAATVQRGARGRRWGVARRGGSMGWTGWTVRCTRCTTRWPRRWGAVSTPR